MSGRRSRKSEGTSGRPALEGLPPSIPPGPATSSAQSRRHRRLLPRVLQDFPAFSILYSSITLLMVESQFPYSARRICQRLSTPYSENQLNQHKAFLKWHDGGAKSVTLVEVSTSCVSLVR